MACLLPLWAELERYLRVERLALALLSIRSELEALGDLVEYVESLLRLDLDAELIKLSSIKPGPLSGVGALGLKV